YWETAQAQALAAGQAPPPVKLPVGFITFPGEIFQAPRSWVELGYPNLTYFHEADRGGHFAAWEEPELFATEIRAAFKPLRYRQPAPELDGGTWSTTITYRRRCKNSGRVRIRDGQPRVRARASSLKRDRDRGVPRRKRRSACRQRSRFSGRRGRHGHPGGL